MSATPYTLCALPGAGAEARAARPASGPWACPITEQVTRTAALIYGIPLLLDSGSSTYGRNCGPLDAVPNKGLAAQNQQTGRLEDPPQADAPADKTSVPRNLPCPTEAEGRSSRSGAPRTVDWDML